MSCPCYDAMDEPEPWSDDDTAWQGDVHASSDWEALEALAGPEYWMWESALADIRRMSPNANTRTYWQGHE